MDAVKQTLLRDLLDAHGRELVALRHHFKERRVALVLGAGFSSAFGIPVWESFLDNLSQTFEARIVNRDKHRHLKKGQALYTAFTTNYEPTTEVDQDGDKSLHEARRDAAWLALLTKTLYADSLIHANFNTPSERLEQIERIAKESYHYTLISAFAEQGNVIINYNFDDVVESILEVLKDKGAKLSAYSSWGSGPKRIPNKVNVYHPNGFLPHDRTKGSTNVTLLESSFQAHIQDAAVGSHAQFSAFLLEHSCLMVGISLDDPTLCFHLAQCATIRPGHYHFCIIRKTPELTAQEETQIRQTLLDLYNVVAIFSEEHHIPHLIELLCDSDLGKTCNQIGRSVEEFRFTYYLTGCVSSGKSTTLSHLSGFTVHGEWSADMPPEMNRAYHTLSKEELARVEEYVNSQVASKNLQAKDSSLGLNIFDRCPLDALAFTTREDWTRRAGSMLSKLNEGAAYKLQPGVVIVLTGDPHEMLRRSIRRGKDQVSYESLDSQQKALVQIYSSIGPGVVFLDTRGKSTTMIVRELIAIVFCAKFVPAKLHEALVALTKEGGSSCE